MRQTDKRADLSARPRCDREHSLNHGFVIVSQRHAGKPPFCLPKRATPQPSYLVTQPFSSTPAASSTPDAPAAKRARVPPVPVPASNFDSPPSLASVVDWQPCWPFGREVPNRIAGDGESGDQGETFFCSKGIGAGPVLISRATLIALSHRTMQFDSIRITPPQPEFLFRLNYSCLQTGACLVPPLYGSLTPSRLCALPPVASTLTALASPRNGT